MLATLRKPAPFHRIFCGLSGKNIPHFSTIFLYTFKNEKNVFFFSTFPYENSETRFSRREIRHTDNNNKKIS
jgi:hypothetical protein